MSEANRALHDVHDIFNKVVDVKWRFYDLYEDTGDENFNDIYEQLDNVIDELWIHHIYFDTYQDYVRFKEANDVR